MTEPYKMLQAGRIRWTSRDARKALGKSVDSRYRKVIAIIIESGFIYSVSNLVYIIASFVLDKAPLTQIGATIPSQLAGLAPTLIIIGVDERRGGVDIQPTN
ncbi:hypothetical protein V5O48_006362 [Marasmius crinis-equi]|uniref:Uncharacterized protein n=1 Tax=Marasmius crinis-equi TaxID=585013 RepID=A0ABR3FKL9_9AGAR